MGDRGPQAGLAPHRPAAPLAAYPSPRQTRRGENSRPPPFVRFTRVGARRGLAHDRKIAGTHAGPDDRSLRPSRPRHRQGIRRAHRRQHRPRPRCYGIAQHPSATLMTALTETINGLYKAEVIHRRGPWRGIVTLTAWLRHGRCFSVSGCARYPTVVTAFHRSSSSMPSGSIAVSC